MKKNLPEKSAITKQKPSQSGKGRHQAGMIFLIAVLFSSILLTTVSVWYQKIVLQTHIADQLLWRHTLYMECNTLIPKIREHLKSMNETQLSHSDSNFLTIQVDHVPRWRIDRSTWKNRKIRFTFHLLTEEEESFQITIPHN